jgi:hypothetical protein
MNRRKLAEFEQGILQGQVAQQDSAARIRDLRQGISAAKATLRIRRGEEMAYGASPDMRSAEQCEADIAKWSEELEVAQAAHDALAEKISARRVLAENCRNYIASHASRSEPDSPYTVPRSVPRMPGTPAPEVARMEVSAAALRASLSEASGPPKIAASAIPTVRRS